MLPFIIGSTIGLVNAEDKFDAKKIDQLISPYEKFGIFSGSVLIAKKKQIIYQKGFGLANHEWAMTNGANTKYGIGSLSKTITATLTMKLVQQGKLNLDDPLLKFFPEWPNKKARKITVHHLLNHTSGLVNYFAIPGWTKGHFNRSISEQAFIDTFANLELAFEPGEQYLYSNSGYLLLAKIIEKVTNKSFVANLNEEIFLPLAMHDTGINFQQQIVTHRAQGYRWHYSKGLKNQPYINMSLFKGAGDLYSTTEDLFKFSQSFANNSILNKSSLATVFNPKNSYGWQMGQLEIVNQRHQIVTYAGQLLGFSSILTNFIDKDYTIIILSNNGTSYYERKQLTQEIAAFLFKYDRRDNKLPLTFILSESLMDGDTAKVIEDYQRSPTDYSTDENRINALAEQLLWSGANKRALDILNLNKELYPNSAKTERLLQQLKETIN